MISSPFMSDRLACMGLTLKEHVTCILGGRKDSMNAYLVRGTLIALRTSDAKEILVRSLGGIEP